MFFSISVYHFTPAFQCQLILLISVIALAACDVLAQGQRQSLRGFESLLMRILAGIGYGTKEKGPSRRGTEFETSIEAGTVIRCVTPVQQARTS